MDMDIRKATNADVGSIVEIHKAAFEKFFLTSLGSRFLELYYSTFINSDKGVVYCAVDNDEIVGFSATSYISKGFNACLIKENFVKYAVESILLLFTKPKAILRLAKNMDKESKDAAVKDDGLYAELYSIAVKPGNQGSGIGNKLLIATEEDVAKHNSKISLTTDYSNNEKTIGFYHSLGYQDYYEFVTYPNRSMWRMIKSLSEI